MKKTKFGRALAITGAIFLLFISALSGRTDDDAPNVPQAVKSLTPTPDYEKSVDVSVKFYESARAELIQRISLRDGALLFYIAIVGSYLAFVASNYFLKPAAHIGLLHAATIMLSLPVVCLVFSLIILQHHFVIGQLSKFVRDELTWGPLGKKVSADWDSSPHLLKRGSFILTLRFASQALVLCLPLMYDIAFAWQFRTPPNDYVNKPLWVIVMLCLVIINASFMAFVAWLHVFVHESRKSDFALGARQRN